MISVVIFFPISFESIFKIGFTSILFRYMQVNEPNYFEILSVQRHMAIINKI